jgi:hypothetical protein
VEEVEKVEEVKATKWLSREVDSGITTGPVQLLDLIT